MFKLRKLYLETFAKALIVDKVQGVRNAGTEIVRSVQRGCEYRATRQFAQEVLLQRSYLVIR